jgi:SAM-dependent methyltransferase
MRSVSTVGYAAQDAGHGGASASATVRVTGHVAAGRGLGTSFVARNTDALRQALGTDIINGSLNVILKHPLMLHNGTAIKCSYGKDGSRQDWRGRLNGTDVWLHRWPRCPLHVVELLAPVHLRSHLGLSDGDEVVIEVRAQDIGRISDVGRWAWPLLWLGRRAWVYTDDRYLKVASRWGVRFGATQFVTDKTRKDLTMAIAKQLARRVPGHRRLWKYARRLAGKNDKPAPYRFERTPLNAVDPPAERTFCQLRNILNYTKTSGSVYSAYRYPAGYHTIEIGDRTLVGQRQPAERLRPVPVEFAGKTVLDIGCNQGGMLFALPDVRWAVGIDYDRNMVNAANRIRSLKKRAEMAFYVVDLEQDPIELIEDFLPEPRVDIVFLLAVCRWVTNWQEVISWAARISGAMLFETTGPDEIQQTHIEYLKKLYAGDVVLLAERSEDDPRQKRRKLFYCGGSTSDPVGPDGEISQ